jgi:hypothetical protein
MRTDRRTLARAFEDAGVERDKAEHVADLVFDAIRENVATKVDIAAARAAVEQARIALNARIDLVERRLVIRGAALLAVAWLGASYERQPCA